MLTNSNPCSQIAPTTPAAQIMQLSWFLSFINDYRNLFLCISLLICEHGIFFSVLQSCTPIFREHGTFFAVPQSFAPTSAHCATYCCALCVVCHCFDTFTRFWRAFTPHLIPSISIFCLEISDSQYNTTLSGGCYPINATFSHLAPVVPKGGGVSAGSCLGWVTEPLDANTMSCSICVT